MLVLVMLAGAADRVHAQERTGHIYGRVVDASNSILVGTTVTVTEARTGTTRVVVTNEQGNYSAPRLETGDYTVEAELDGFVPFRRTGVVLGAGTVAEINIMLQVGGEAETVEVTGTPPMVNTSSGAVRTEISPVFVERLPLPGRNSNDLIELIPGMTSGVTGNYAANGARESSNNFTLDGTANTDTFHNTVSRNPPPDALQEFVVQSNYSAEYGRGGGVAVIAITKSGTNELHGSVYDYFQGENLNANSFERNAEGLPKSDFKRHQWGVTVGGPVVLPRLHDGHNQTFFFFNMQRLGTPADPYLYRRGGLTAAELAGDFSQSKIIPTVSATAAAAPNSPFAGMAGQQITDLSPYLSETAVRWYELFDLPIVENSGDFFSESRTASESQPEYTARVDHSLHANNRVSFSMFHRSDAPEPTHIRNAPEGFRQGRRLVHQHYSVSDVWTIGSSVVNEVRVGYNHISDTEVPEFGDVDFSALGLPFPRLSEGQFISLKSDEGDFAPSAFNMEAPSSKLEERDIVDFRNTLSFVKGNHLMKAGVTIQINDVSQVLNQNMEYQYAGQFLGNRAAEFLIGWPESFGNIGPTSSRPARRNVYNAFVQDDWKVSPSLTLNLGLRWEPYLWGYMKDDSVLMFFPGARSRFDNFPPGTILVTEPPSPSRSGKTNDWDNFAPRLGSAYRLDDEGKLVLRGGWGMFYDSVPGAQDGVDVHTDAFINSWGARFDRGYPGPEGWLDIFAYEGLSTPDFSNAGRIDPSEREFNPRSRPGQYQPPLENGFFHQFNVTFEHEFRPGWTYSAAYIGSRGVDLWGLDYWNLPVHRDENDSWDSENMASRRPDQEFRLTDKNFTADNGKSTYDAAQLTLRANASSFHLLSHYTYSRAYANIDGIRSRGDAVGFGRSNPTDLEADWARSVMDVPHRLLVMSSWEVPVLRGRRDLLGAILGDWIITSVFNIQSGRLANVVANQNNTFTCEGCWVRPNATGEPLINEDWREDPDLVYVNAAAFSQPEDGTFGNLPRNAVRWPHTKSVDMSVSKTFPIFRQAARFELRVDVFNLFNWVNFHSSERIVLSDPLSLTGWGAGIGGPRTFQLGGRIVF